MSQMLNVTKREKLNQYQHHMIILTRVLPIFMKSLLSFYVHSSCKCFVCLSLPLVLDDHCLKRDHVLKCFFTNAFCLLLFPKPWDESRPRSGSWVIAALTKILHESKLGDGCLLVRPRFSSARSSYEWFGIPNYPRGPRKVDSWSSQLCRKYCEVVTGCDCRDQTRAPSHSRQSRGLRYFVIVIFLLY